MVSLDEAKMYLRIDANDDDVLIQELIKTAHTLCHDVIRNEQTNNLEPHSSMRFAILYAIAYMYEHREEANHNELVLTLRALLFGIRQEKF